MLPPGGRSPNRDLVESVATLTNHDLPRLPGPPGHAGTVARQTPRIDMRKLPLSIQWAIAICLATAAFYTMGQIPNPRGPSYQPEIFGVRDWFSATFSAGFLGAFLSPPTHRRSALCVFSCAPVVGIYVGLIYKSSHHALRSPDVGAFVGAFVASVIGALISIWMTTTSR